MGGVGSCRSDFVPRYVYTEPKRLPQLVRHGRTVTTFFDLLGSLKNDMTDALAFTLSRSTHLLQALVADLGYRKAFSHDNTVLSVQTRRPTEGITDTKVPFNPAAD